MAIRKLVLLVALSLLALPSFVIADHEHRVTVQMRNGDRVSGLARRCRERPCLRARQSTRSAAAAGWRCAVIDFVGGASGLPDTELSVAAKPDHLVVLRNGSSWTGRFVDVHGGEATPRPERRTRSSSATGMRSAALPRSSRPHLLWQTAHQSTAASQPTNIPAGAIRVPGNAYLGAHRHHCPSRRSADVPNVRRSAVVGRRWWTSRGRQGPRAGRRAAGAPLPNDLAGALIGKIGNSAPFGIGDLTTPIHAGAR